MTRPPKECQPVKSNFDTCLFSFSVLCSRQLITCNNHFHFSKKKKKKGSGKSKNVDICLGHFYDVCLKSCCCTKLISIFSTTPLLSKFAPHLIEVFFLKQLIQSKRSVSLYKTLQSSIQTFVLPTKHLFLLRHLFVS